MAIIAILVAGIITAIVFVIYGISTYNQAARLRNLAEAKTLDNTSEFDNMWKKISQVSQVTTAQKNALKEIFEGYAAARTGSGGGGEVMKWIKESVPNVDTSTFNNLQNIITGSRDSWTNRQKELIDIARQYNQMLATFPDGPFLRMFGFEKIVPKVVTSSRTDKAFETGKDDDVKLDMK